MFTKNLLSGMWSVALLLLLSSAVQVQAQNFKLQILHNNDGESKLLPLENGYGGAAQFLGTVNALRFDAFRGNFPSILLSSGDNFLPGPATEASLALPESEAPYDSRVFNLLNYDAFGIGNHDFDLGPDYLARIINGLTPTRAFPKFLSANLDFSGEPALQALFESGRITKSTILFRANERIGVIGLTTPSLPTISSPRNVTVMSNLAEIVNTEVTALSAAGVNKIILISHLQGIEEELELISRLRGIDVVIAGGGDDVLANNPSQVVPGDEIKGPYPLRVNDADGRTVFVVTTGGDYKYVGNLIVTFDAAGNIIELDETSGPVPVIGKVNPQMEAVIQPVADFINNLNQVVVGRTEVDLDGRRNSVRGVETNQGNLIADAFLQQAQQLAASFGAARPNVSISNGGGIRNNNIITAGSNITLGTTFSILPFGNVLSVINPITPEQFKIVMENAVSKITPAGPTGDGTGRFAQIGGFTLEYALAGEPLQIQNGVITNPGSRVRTITLNDGTKVVENGNVVAGAPEIVVATIDFLATGGDEYPFGNTGFTRLGITDQKALQNYIVDDLNGVITAAKYPQGGEGRIKQVEIPARRTVVDVIVQSEVHNTLEVALVAAGLIDALNGDGPFTVFAPTDEAFNALPTETIQALLANPTGDLRQILLYHVLGAKVLSTDLSNGLTATTLQGKDITVTINNEGIFINNAKVTVADIVTDNGVVHVIDAVLLPPARRTVVDVIVQSDVHNTLEAAVVAAELVDALNGDGPFTVFAPTDAAFAALPAGTVEALLADPTGDLRQILLYHVLGAKVLSTDLSDGLTATTLQGKDITVTINNEGIFINNAKVTVADIVTDNGVVHVIDAVLLPPADETGEVTFDLVPIGTYRTGQFNAASTEIVAFDKLSKRLFFTNAQVNTIGILNIDNPEVPTLISEIDMSPYGGGVNSVAAFNGLIAVAVEAEVKTDNGKVVFFDANGTYLNEVMVGALPDMLLFNYAGTKVLVANEGEPNDDYTVDPEGSVSIIDVADGVMNAVVTNISFESFNPFVDALKAEGVRVFGPNATLAQDFEPEYITISEDDATAFVALQENNALAVIDIASATITSILPLGFKDHSIEGNGLDASDRATTIDIKTHPVKGIYMPDAIRATTINSKTYIVTANEGDTRAYDGFSEERRVSALELDPTAFPNASDLKRNANLGRLLATSTLGDTDGDGDYDEIYTIGGRSFSIWDAEGKLVFDSGDEFERVIAEVNPSFFNSNHTANNFKTRSDDKGPEPEAIEVVKLQGRVFALIGLERVGGIFVYDITNPTNGKYISYVNNRNFQAATETPEAGDLGLEDLKFIAAEDSPTGQPLVVSANEVSGTVTLFSVNVVLSSPSTPAITPLVEKAVITNNTKNLTVAPNPASDWMNLTYDVAKTGHINVFITNMQGQRVATLFNGTAEQGTYNLNIVPAQIKMMPGLYFISIQTEGKLETVTVSVK